MKNLTKIEIFDNFDENRNFFGNLNKNEILTKIEFSQIWPKSKIFEIFKKIEIFRTFDQNRNFSKFSKKIEIFCKFWPKSKFLENFGKFWLKSIFFSKLTMMENFQKIDPNFFFRNFDQNRNYSKFWPKSKILENFNQKRNFSQS